MDNKKWGEKGFIKLTGPQNQLELLQICLLFVLSSYIVIEFFLLNMDILIDVCFENVLELHLIFVVFLLFIICGHHKIACKTCTYIFLYFPQIKWLKMASSGLSLKEKKILHQN